MTIIVPSRIVWDVETKYYVDDPYDAELSTITMIDTEKPGHIMYYEESEINEAIRIMLASPGLVGFNSKAFDIPVLMKYVDRGHGRKLRAKPHFDIYDEFMRKYQRRISLANMSRNTLVAGKFDLVTDTATSMWKTDPWKLYQYNAWDTYVTYLLYVHVCSFGYLNFKLPTLRRFTPETISRPGMT